MRIAALSDFHIGADARSDCFRHSSGDFLALLDSLERDHDCIVFLGDIFQAQHGPGVGRRAEASELERARQRVPELWRRLCSEGYRYVHGNHDQIARTELGARSSVRFDDGEFTVFMTHGHQFDPLLSRAYLASRAATWFSGRVRGAGLGRVADWLEHKDVTIKHGRFRGPDGPYARGARQLMREHQADVVVMGHTHVPIVLDLPEGTLANTGTCSLGQTTFVSIDTSTRQVRLVDEARR